jgi:two-component system, OmpR family, response regulator RstA
MNANNAPQILLVEDDAALAEIVADFLVSHGFEVTTEARGDTAVGRIITELPAAVILDVNLPGLDGFSVCREVRSAYPGPIMILTARGSEIDEVIGLEVGADDYMAKPVRPRALLARLQSLLRRGIASIAGDAPPHKIQLGQLIVDEANRAVQIEGTALDLTTAEFDLLLLLAKNAGKVLSRNDIYEQIHGVKFDGVDRSIDLRISRLRKKLGDDPTNPERIKSVRGVGYILPLNQ